MCGIAGVVVSGGGAKRFRGAMDRMVRALGHRGPDGCGVVEFDRAILGHTRLSIVDLASGAQPMRCAVDERMAVTFNGEIYGFRELKEQVAGYPWRTTSDTEVLLAMYREELREASAAGRFVEKLPGMFAFGIWDDAVGRLIAARDRFGEKPFYFAEFEEGGRKGLVFASEMKAILASSLVVPRLNRDALAHYLQYLYVHPRQTIYENVRALPPGCRLIWANGETWVEQCWKLPAAREKVDVKEAVERFRFLMQEAVRKQLVADVPVGAFLSGGLDSSTVVATAAKLKPGLQTYAFRFAAGGVDECPYAEALALMHGTEHHVLDDVETDVGAMLLEMAGVYDEPFGDSSNIPTYLISKLARGGGRHLKVVLTGDGGDELLGGYPWYRGLLGVVDDEVAEARLKQTRYFSDATLEKFGLAPSKMVKDSDGAGVDRAMRMDLLDYMPGDILTKVDRASMAHGLELRAPFLDVALAEFLISLPAAMKIDGSGDKLILRKAFEDLWPETVKTRSKAGFGAPVATWLRRPSVQELVRTRLYDRKHRLYEVIPFDASRVAVERHDAQAWAMLVLALWLENNSG